MKQENESQWLTRLTHAELKSLLPCPDFGPKALKEIERRFEGGFPKGWNEIKAETPLTLKVGAI